MKILQVKPMCDLTPETIENVEVIVKQVPDITAIAARQAQISILTFTGAITGIVTAAMITANIQPNLTVARIEFINRCILQGLIPLLLAFALALYTAKELEIRNIVITNYINIKNWSNFSFYNWMVGVGLISFILFSFLVTWHYNSQILK